MTVAREFVESRTAKVPGRPVFNAMMREVERGEADGILAWHPDRLARNSVDGGPDRLRPGHGRFEFAEIPRVLVREHAAG